MTPRLLFVCPDISEPSGGLKQIYRQVDILNSYGYTALVVHQKQGFSPQWFDHETPTTYHYLLHAELNNQPASKPQWYVKLREAQFSKNDLIIQDTDILIFPEVYGPRITEVFSSNFKVIYNQGCYQALQEFPIDVSAKKVPYNHPKVLASLVNSDDAMGYMHYLFPKHPTFKIRHSIDTNQFQSATHKKKQILYMSRKNHADIKQVLQMNSLRGNLAHWELIDIDHFTHADVSKAMQESSIFLSSNLDEGFGLPAIEAIASGCIVIGYPGKGGKEYFKEDFTMAIPEKNILLFAKKLEEVIKQIEKNPNYWNSQTDLGRNFVAKNYNEMLEKLDMEVAWNFILEKYNENIDA